MKTKTLMCLAAMSLFNALVMPLRVAAQESEAKKEPTRYTVIDLGTFGTAFSIAQGINNKGWIEGIVGDASGQQHEFLLRKGMLTNLGTLGGPNSGVSAFFGQSPNERGQIAGAAETANRDPLAEGFCNFLFASPPTDRQCLPFVWKKGVMTPLPTLGGTNGGASQINNRGQVVGEAESTDFFPGCSSPHLSFQPVIWEKGIIHQLPTVGGDPGGSIDAINDRGQAVGATGNCSNSLHAVLWQDGMATDLGNLGGTFFIEGTAINNESQVVGFSNLPGDATFHAFLWQDGSIADLGAFPGDNTSFASAINNKGQIVGTSLSCSGQQCPTSRAVLWENGSIFDLNSLIPATSPLFLLQAVGINERGEITGFTADFHGFLAIPCDEEQADNEGCQLGAGNNSASQKRNVVLPENVRKMIRQQVGRYPKLNLGKGATD